MSRMDGAFATQQAWLCSRCSGDVATLCSPQARHAVPACRTLESFSKPFCNNAGQSQRRFRNLNLTQRASHLVVQSSRVAPGTTRHASAVPPDSLQIADAIDQIPVEDFATVSKPPTCQQDASSSHLGCQTVFDKVPYSPADEEAVLRRSRADSLAEYAALKDRLLRNTQRAGSALTLYLFLVASGEVAWCTLLGSVASYGYLTLLIRDVDTIGSQEQLPSAWAESIRSPPLRSLAKAVAAYRQALQPRLLIPVGLAAAMAVYNHVASQPLTVLQEAAVMGGFLSYKGALILKVYDDLKPKVMTIDEITKPRRPSIPDIEDVENLLQSKPKDVPR